MFRTMPPALGLLALVLGLTMMATPGPRAAAQGVDEEAVEAAAKEEAEAIHGADPAEAGSEGEHAETPNILEPQLKLAITTLVVFLLLLLVLWRMAWGPLSKALHDREHQHEEAYRLSEASRSEAERLLAEHRRQMEQAGDQVRAILDEARRDAQATAEDIIKKAQDEAEAARQRAQREIGQARDEALVEIWSKTADLAVAVAGKVIQGELDEGGRRRLVDRAMAELPAAPDGRRGGLA